jgi:outer membrane protein OmpA-like peptidoglycan-associated protein
MKLVVHSLFVVLLLSVASTSVRAQDNPDAEGCKDSPILVRMQGSTIFSCDHKEFDQATMPTDKDKDGNGVDKTLEGGVSTWTYSLRDGVTGLQVVRNFEAAFKHAGLSIDFEDGENKIVAHKGNTWIQIEPGPENYAQTIVAVKEMKQEVTADASSLSDELANTGRVTVYGIHFETGKANILADSEGTLQEIVKFMTANTTAKLRVEGHTDNVGTPEANQSLSEQRAQGVVVWLVAHGVPAARLSSRGWGGTQPVADNSTVAGRARNRRVELVKEQ